MAIELAKQQGNDFVNAWYNKGVALYCLGQYKEEHRSAYLDCIPIYTEAKECFDMAIKLNDKYADAWYFRGITLFHLKHYDEATRSFDEATQRNHNHPSAWYSKGIALYRLGRYGDAADCFDRVIHIYKVRGNNEDDGDLALAWLHKGQAFRALKEYSEAIECFDKAINIDKLDSDHSDQAYLYRGESKYELERYPEALADFSKVVVSDNNGKKYNNIGLCHYRLELYEQAKDDFCTCTRLDPKVAIAFYNLAVMYNNIENNPNKAKRMFETCLNIDRNFSKAEVAIKKLGGRGSPHKIEWYNWWFTRGKGKKVLGLFLIVSVLIPFLIITLVVDYFVTHLALHTTMHTGLTSIIKDNATAIITGLTALIGISIGVLLLPSLTRIKVGVIEFDAASTDSEAKNIEFKPIGNPMDLDLGKKRLDFEMESFTMPLEFQMQGLTMPISVNMGNLPS
jgi:tetratricopeptide (TPR) repeat protein